MDVLPSDASSADDGPPKVESARDPAVPERPSREAARLHVANVVQSTQLGLTMGCFLTAVTVGIARAFSIAVSSAAADGQDVYGALDLQKEPYALLPGFFVAVLFIAPILLFGQAARLFAPSWRAPLWMKACCVYLAVGPGVIEALVGRAPAAAMSAPLQIGLAAYVSRTAPHRGLRLMCASFLLSALWLFVLLFAVLPIVASPSTSDTTRLLLRVVAFPLGVEVSTVLARAVGMMSPTVLDVTTLMHWETLMRTLSALWGRILLLFIADGGMLTLASLLVACVEPVMRLSQRRRDRVVRRWLLGANGVPDRLEHTVKGTSVLVEELIELAATIAAAAAFIAFRVSRSPVAPDPLDIVRAAGLQLALEVAVALAPAVVLLAVDVPLLQRMVERRRLALRLAKMAKHPAKPFATAAAAGLVLTSALARVSDGVVCPWSEREGWWHMVPCS